MPNAGSFDRLRVNSQEMPNQVQMFA
jgi:hypothetical protein